MPKYEKPTIATFKAKQNKDIPFAERAKKFEEAIKPFTEEYGVNHMGILNNSHMGIIPEIVLVDMWQKNEPDTTNSQPVENVS